MISTISWRSLLRRAGRKGFDPTLHRSSAVEVGAAPDPQPAPSRGCSPVQKQSLLLGETCPQRSVFTETKRKDRYFPEK